MRSLPGVDPLLLCFIAVASSWYSIPVSSMCERDLAFSDGINHVSSRNFALLMKASGWFVWDELALNLLANSSAFSEFVL